MWIMFRAHFFRPVKRSNLSSNTIMAYCEALLVIAKSCSLLPHYRPISISTLQSQNDYKYNQTYTNCRVQFCASVNHQIASIGEAYKKLAVVDEKVARYCHTICTSKDQQFLDVLQDTLPQSRIIYYTRL